LGSRVFFKSLPNADGNPRASRSISVFSRPANAGDREPGNCVPSRQFSQSDREFDDASREWRRIFAEFWGTFLVVLVVAGGDIASVKSSGATTSLMAGVSSGVMVMVTVYSLGSVSGAHLNPAVTIAFSLRGNFPWRRAPGYIVAQNGGAVAAAALLLLLFGRVAELGATTPRNGVSPWQAFAIETVLTTALVNTILATASGARNIGPNAGIAVGGYNVAAKLWALPLTGASMNPARSLGPDLIRGDLSTSWIYILAPLLGALIGVAFEWILKGPPAKAGAEAAQGEASSKKS
jgi:aquaporin Z